MSETQVAKRGKRIITPARKEQNRVAQKLYRQRQKVRTQSHENGRDERRVRQKRPPLKPRLASDANVERLVNSTSEIRAFTIDMPITSLPHGPQPIDQNLLQDFDLRPTALGPFDFAVSSPTQDAQTVSSSNIMIDAESSYTRSPSDDMQDGSLMRDSSTLDYLVIPLMTPAMFRSSSIQSKSGSNHHLLQEERWQDTGDDQSTLATYNRHINAYTEPQRARNVPTPTVPFPKSTPDYEAVARSVTTWLSGSRYPPLPSVYLNKLSGPLTTLLVAYLQNASSVSFSIPSLLTHQSPFHSPSPMSSSTTSILAAARKPSIPSDLQPTLPQILIRHHPYLDLLPCPGLRARAIVLSTGGMFEAMDLKRDVFSGGLRWRGRGAPWEGSNWIVEDWFWGKWRMLFE